MVSRSIGSLGTSVLGYLEFVRGSDGITANVRAVLTLISGPGLGRGPEF